MYVTKTYLGPCKIFMINVLCKNNQRLLAHCVKYRKFT